MLNLGSKARVSICIVVAVALGLAAWLAFALLDEGKPALQEKDELVGSLTPGRILYIRWEEFQGPEDHFLRSGPSRNDHR